jgi:small-conductance mechanosensitive channel
MDSILLFNTVLSVGAIAGSAVWAAQNDIFTLSSAYNFYWFVSVVSFLLCVSGYVLHMKTPLTTLSFNYSSIVLGIVALVVLFWLSAAASVASVSRDCIYIKNRFGSRFYYFQDTQINNDSLSCTGEIITTTFGFASFVVWSIVSYFVGKHVYSSYQTPSSGVANSSPGDPAAGPIDETPPPVEKLEMVEVQI